MIGPYHGEPTWDEDHRVFAVHKLAEFYVGCLGNIVGGALHIVLSDGNLEDGHIVGCINDAEKAGDHVAVALGKCLLELTLEQRQEIYEGTDA